MFTKMKQSLLANKKTLVLPEGEDLRVLSAASRLTREGLMNIKLLGNVEKIQKLASENNVIIDGIELVDPVNHELLDEMTKEMVILRKGKMSEEECMKALSQTNYFGTMLVKMGKADALLGGATYSTADTVRPALQLVKTKPGAKIVSSCFILVRIDKNGQLEKYAMGDCAINIDPTEDELVEIAVETANTARIFDIEPKVAMLSFSTKGSGKGERVDKVRNATDKIKALNPDFLVDGELQFDSAFSKEVARVKAKDSPVAGQANTFIFPSIEAGNIAYKTAQWFGGFMAYGPILQGLNAPINDLSRGCNVEEIYTMSIITLAQSL